MKAATLPEHDRLAWSSAYACGHPQVDAQHRQLLELARLVLDAAGRKTTQPGATEAVVEPVLQALKAYALAHFGYEESILAGVGSAACARHRAQHRQLSAEIEELAIDYQLGLENAFVQKLSAWVVTRLVHHMTEEDRAAFGAPGADS